MFWVDDIVVYKSGLGVILMKMNEWTIYIQAD